MGCLYPASENCYNQSQYIYLQLKQFIKKNKQNQFSVSNSLMSIYSGFATRHQQQSYDQLIEDLIFVLQKRIIKFYNNELADQSKFLDVLINLHQSLAKMEQNKYLQPKTSRSIEELLRFIIKNIVNEDNNAKDKLTKHNSVYDTRPNNKELKPIANTTSLLQVKNENKQLSRRDSLNKLNQPVSIGKIIKQIGSKQNLDDNHNQSNSLASSRNTFVNQNKLNFNNANNKTNKKNSSKNPEQQEPDYGQNQKVNKTQIQYKSRFKNNKEQNAAQTERNLGKDKNKQKQTRDYLLQYLQKNNKNYLRGYRKRQVKTRGYSKQYSANY